MIRVAAQAEAAMSGVSVSEEDAVPPEEGPPEMPPAVEAAAKQPGRNIITGNY